jgi:vacuolar-type H+-ATPase subunit I/STV1
MSKLDVKAFGFALGVVWGGLMFLLGVADMLYFWGNAWGRMMNMIYVGYSPTVFGIISGAICGFVYASLLGFIMAWIYNRFVEENRVEREKKIRELAKKIWEKKGRPSGSSNDDWREAERQIRGE